MSEISLLRGEKGIQNTTLENLLFNLINSNILAGKQVDNTVLSFDLASALNKPYLDFEDFPRVDWQFRNKNLIIGYHLRLTETGIEEFMSSDALNSLRDKIYGSGRVNSIDEELEELNNFYNTDTYTTQDISMIFRNNSAYEFDSKNIPEGNSFYCSLSNEDEGIWDLGFVDIKDNYVDGYRDLLVRIGGEEFNKFPILTKDYHKLAEGSQNPQEEFMRLYIEFYPEMLQKAVNAKSPEEIVKDMFDNLMYQNLREVTRH